MKKYGLLGEKLGHSYSKMIHEAISDTYDLIEVAREDIDKFMKKADFDAINVTIPYKQTVIPYLDEIDEKALNIGAVNTIVNKNGKLIGYNTDYYGFKYIIEHNNITVENKNCLILGTGGTSKTATSVLTDMNASLIDQASINKGEGTVTYEDLDLSKYDIVVNTTPVGMYPNIDNKLIDLEGYDNIEALVDVIYNPTRTSFLSSNVNAIKTNGLDMLIYQAIKAHEYFTGNKVDDNILPTIRKKIKESITNIVLIGMPGCGKTTIAKSLASTLDFNVIDIDSEIEKRAEMKISDIFKNFGEAHFRKLESEVIKEASLLKKTIISTGGGAILNPKNMFNLRSNGIVIYLEKEIDNIIKDFDTSTRPLSKSKEDLVNLFNVRKALYEKYADIVIDNNNKIEETVKNLKEELDNYFKK